MESTRCSSLLSSGILVYMPSPEELVRRKHAGQLRGLFMHLKSLLWFQTIKYRVLTVNLKGHEALESYPFCEEKQHRFWAATLNSLVSKQILSVNKVHFKAEFVNKGHNLVFPSIF